MQKAGTAAMPPHILYVLTDKGREELEVAARLTKA
ncbi:DNA-binding PadR family transcriptional regulator [Bradyrhizobium sp. USDA 4341]